MNDAEYENDIEVKNQVYNKMCRFRERTFLEACDGVFNQLFACQKAKDEVIKIKENL